MSLSTFFKKKDFFTEEENSNILEAIRNAEINTSGEVRVYIESKNPLVDPLERAAEIFKKLKMENTHQRNGVLLYLATHHKEVALFGDEGIYKSLGKDYWNNEVSQMLGLFKANKLSDGIVLCINHIGKSLSEKFPYISSEDKNELPDEIVFGK